MTEDCNVKPVEPRRDPAEPGKPSNCLSYWYPLAKGALVPMPRTIFAATDLPYSVALSTLDQEWSKAEKKELAKLYRSIESAGDILGWPCFLRTGHTSAKHMWRMSCYLKNAAEIPSHVQEIVEYGELSGLVGPPTNVWVVREFLPTAPPFWAFAGDMPITKERRYFVKDGKVVCHHPYWPEAAIQGHLPTTRNWKAALRKLNTESELEVAQLTALSEKVSQVVPGAWSVDWLATERGWYLIDMARADSSFHWPGCPKGE